jgi:hypothetical protein
MKKYAILSLIFSAAVLAAEAVPVAAFNFDKMENNKVPASIGKYTASLVRPELVKTVPGMLGNALHFSGGYKGNKAGALIVRNFKFDFSKPFTVEALVKFDDKISHKNNREVFNIADGERGPGIRFNFYYNSFALRTGDGKKLSGTGTSNVKVKVTAEEWHLATTTYDGTTLKFYFDGVLAGEKAISVTNAAKNRTLTVGSYKSGFCYPLRGAVDDLKFYNVCKNAAEVAEKYISIFGE